jgi:hypothetical protein
MQGNLEEEVLLDAFEKAFQAIDLLCETELHQPCLVLLYSTIDAAAWLSVSGEADVSRNAFTGWVDAFLLPGSSLECTALDLYGARCGILHSMSAFSALSRSGKVRTISYAWGSASLSELQGVLRYKRRDDIVAVHINDLRAALRSGFQVFLDKLGSDAQLRSGVLARARQHFAMVPVEPRKTLIERTRKNDAE